MLSTLFERRTRAFSPSGIAKRVDLPPLLRVETIADNARFAAFAIMASVRDGWGRTELAQWLVGPYARATEPAHWASRPGVPPIARSVSDSEVDVVLKSAHASVVECVRYARSWHLQRGFARRMVDEGLVVGVLDGQMLGYAPIDHRRMRLVDRIRSLFVADYLTRPGAYETFQVCDCGLVTFDVAPAHFPDCERPRDSGIMRKVDPPADLTRAG
jgi:hypothetical protein